MAALKLEVDALTDVDEKYHDLYEKDEASGKYRLTGVEGGSWADNDRMKRSIENARKDEKEAEKKAGEVNAELARYKAIGNLDDIVAELNKGKEKEEKPVETELSLAEKTRLRDEREEAKELVELREKVKRLEVQQHRNDVNTEWNKVLSNSRISKQHIDFVQMIGDKVDFVDGTLVLKEDVFGVETGTRAETFISTLVKNRPYLLGETTSTDSGAGSTGEKVVNPWIEKYKTDEEKFAAREAYEVEHGVEKTDKAIAEAKEYHANQKEQS